MANILLIEPGYKNKYPPLGLMKIASYHGQHGKRDRVRFIKGEEQSVLDTAWDRIYVTTLFSFEFSRIAQTIDFARKVANNHNDRIFVGGIAASLMPERFAQERQWHGIRFIKGLLGEAPAVSLQLDQFSEELYADDHSSTPIEDLIPDYSILDHITHKYPVHDAYFAYASRGCIRKCSFCGVPKLEGDQRDTQSLSALVKGIEHRHGTKKDLILMDNNVVASPRFHEIIAEIRDLGFATGARLTNRRVPIQRRVDFNQGVDARILCKDPRYLKDLSTICLKPLRIAFDHLGLKGPYEKAIRYAHDAGLQEMSNYMLYNFHDSPADLYERMRLNVGLNEQLGLRIWSFPMRYQPTDLPERSFIGEKWTRYQLRSMQIILQATHGVVSGAPQFFNRAFGETSDHFADLLLHPHHFIFNRDYYEFGEGADDWNRFRRALQRLSAGDKADLLTLLSSCDPRDFRLLPSRATSTDVKRILSLYRPLDKDREATIWAKQRELRRVEDPALSLPDDERVEDAGLQAEEEPIGNRSRKRRIA